MYNEIMNKQDQRIQLVASTEFRQEVDKWRRNQTDLPSHSESIRRLVKIALRLEKGETMKLLTAIIRPHKYNDVRDALIAIGIEGLSATEIRALEDKGGKLRFIEEQNIKRLKYQKLKSNLLFQRKNLKKL